MSSIKQVMEETFKTVQLTPALFKRLHTFERMFINKNQEHIKFFGGNLLGVNPIKFLPSDKNEFLDDILNIDESDAREKILALPSIKSEDWVRYTDIVNLSCLYLVHLIFKMPVTASFTQKNKEQAMVTVLLILQYKFFSSIMSHYFKYPADEATALATYAALTKKFAIKQQGNWYNVLLQRSQNIIADSSIHIVTLQRFDDDNDIFYMISDIQGRLKEMVKKIWVVFAEIKQMDARILSTGGTIELDGKIVVRDIQTELGPYKKYISKVITERNSFIKQDLIQIIGSAMHTMPEAVLFDVLNYVTDHYNDKIVVDIINETLLHAFSYLSSDRRARESMSDIGNLIAKLRALYMASRSSDEMLLKMRDLGEKIVKKVAVGRSEAVVSSTRTGLLLYIILRTFTMKYYG